MFLCIVSVYNRCTVPDEIVYDRQDGSDLRHALMGYDETPSEIPEQVQAVLPMLRIPNPKHVVEGAKEPRVSEVGVASSGSSSDSNSNSDSDSSDSSGEDVAAVVPEYLPELIEVAPLPGEAYLRLVRPMADKSDVTYRLKSGQTIEWQCGERILGTVSPLTQKHPR